MAQVRKLTGTHPWPLSSGRREVHKQPADEHIRLPANTTETTIQHHGKKQVFASRVIITLRLVQNYFLELAASFCGVLQRVLLLLLSLFLLIFFFFFFHEILGGKRNPPALSAGQDIFMHLCEGERIQPICLVESQDVG